MTVTIHPHQVGKRLDQTLSESFPAESRAYFQRLIQQRLVLVNGRIAKKSTRVALGDEIEVEFALTPDLSVEPEPLPLDILFEDEWLLAVNKKPGLVVHPGAGNWSGTFVNGLLYYCGTLPGDRLRPGIVHRLDKDTSGLLLAAKTERAQRALVELFAQRKIKKEYLALCCGLPKVDAVDAPLGRDPKERKRQAVIDGGKPALTRLEILEERGSLALVRARPHTGRTHQIRVHLKHIGCPILGDGVYGFPAWNAKYNASRQLLHAHRLAFTHPIAGNPVSLEAPIPEDFQAHLRQVFRSLRRSSAPCECTK